MEAGRMNLDLNTTRFLELVGKNKEEECENFQLDDAPINKVEKKNSLNTSLSSVCSSLDNSFYAKKARAKTEKKKKDQKKNEES